MKYQVICQNISTLDNLILIEYKTGTKIKTLGISKYSPDYEIAKNLKPNDKFMIELRDTQIASTKDIEIPDTIYTLPYITGKTK